MKLFTKKMYIYLKIRKTYFSGDKFYSYLLKSQLLLRVN